MACHTEFRKGASVFVQMKDGSSFSDKYEGKKSKFVIMKNAGKIDVQAIRAISFLRRKIKESEK